MKGIIVKYNQEKGFGFIKDENEESRFFHISQIQNKNEFLNNITDYHYTDWEERKCYIINFDPIKNERGLSAVNIKLTNQVFNDISDQSEYEVVIRDLSYKTNTLTRIVSGIKGGNSTAFATAGGNGTFRVGYPEVFRELNISFTRLDDIGWGIFDIRDLVLSINKRNKITDKFIAQLKEKIVGTKTKIKPHLGSWIFVDESILTV